MRKCFGWILSVVFLINIFSFTSFAETNTISASADLAGAEPKLVNIAAVSCGLGAEPLLETVGGSEDVWVLDNTDESRYYIGFDIDGTFAKHITDGSVFDIEIDYYSRGNGFFQLVYDSAKKVERRSDTIVTGDSGKWKTAKISIDDANFNNRIKRRFDFIITIESPRYYQTEVSAAAVPIKAVRIVRHIAKNKITHYGYTEETGNVFPWYNSEKILYNELTNTTAKDITAKVTYYAKDAYGAEQWSKTEDVMLYAGETRTFTVNVDTQRCGLYTLYVDIVNEALGIAQTFKRYNFAIVKTDPRGIKNENYYLAAHFNHYESTVDSGLDVVSKSNTYGIRTEFGWTNVYDSSDRNKNIYSDADKAFHNKLREHDLHLLAIYGFSVIAETGGWKYLPKTEDALNSWAQGIEFVARNTKDICERIEIWNEPNILAFNGGTDYTGEVNKYGVKEDPSVYAEAAKRAYAAAKKGNEEIKVGVMSLVELPHKTAKDFFTEAVLDTKLYDFADALTLHPYSDGSAEHYHNMGDIEKQYVDMLPAENKLPVWNTEYGFSTTDEASNNETKQAQNMVRTPIHLMAEGVGDVNVGYNFEQKGLVPTNREDNFGIVSPGFDSGADKYDKNFVPRQAYVAVTAMNYYLAQATPDGKGNYGADVPEDKINEYDSEHIYKFNSKKFDADIYVIWRTEKETETELDLGVKSVIYADMNGNEEIVESENGKFTFPIGRMPAYIIVKNTENAFGIEDAVLMCKTDIGWKKADSDSIKNTDCIKAVVSGFSHDGENRNVQLVMAYYKESDGGLALVKAEPKTLTFSGTGLIYGEDLFSTQNIEEYDVCKCFVWDMDKLSPYINNVTVR